MTSPKTVSSYEDSGLAVIHMSDGRGNRLNYDGIAALSAEIESSLNNPRVKLILIRSGEESFCLGMDLDNLQQSLEEQGEGSNSAAAAPGDPDAPAAGSQNAPAAGDTNDPSAGDPNDPSSGDPVALRRKAVDAYARLLARIMKGGKPVIALVEGDVKAGGVGLAAACDVVIASETASWELSEVLFGLVPYNVLPYVFSLRMNPQRFRYLVLSAQRIGAERARDYGLADEVYPADQIERKAKITIKTMMRAEPGALASAKDFFSAAIDSSFESKLSQGRDALLTRMEDPAVLSGLEAFANGEAPGWFARFKPENPISGKGMQ